jgi:hypothetical protein
MDKLQRAGRDFLMRLVAKHGLQGAARVLRALAEEIEAAWLETRRLYSPRATVLRFGHENENLDSGGAARPRRLLRR